VRSSLLSFFLSIWKGFTFHLLSVLPLLPIFKSQSPHFSMWVNEFLSDRQGEIWAQRSGDFNLSDPSGRLSHASALSVQTQHFLAIRKGLQDGQISVYLSKGIPSLLEGKPCVLFPGTESNIPLYNMHFCSPQICKCVCCNVM
jgi:hypothetical protein